MTDLATTVRALGLPRLAIMGAVFFALVVFFVYLSTRMSSGQMAPIYTDLELSDAGAMTAKLEALAIPYEVGPDGRSILVPTDQVGAARMALAREGLPSGGSIGYELFDKQDVLTESSFSQSISRVRALEGELQRTIGSLKPVRAARVHLVLPEREMFSRLREKPTASVTLRLAKPLEREQIAAIQHLVANAVPAMKPQDVAILDENGALLTRPVSADEGGAPGLLSDSDEERRRAFEMELVQKIEAMVESIAGPGRVRANVSAELDFARVTTEQESFDPEQQVVRSTSTSEESDSSQDREEQETVSVANQLPPGQTAGQGQPAQSQSTSSRTEEQTNFDIGRTVTRTTRPVGSVKRLSVAVLVDGTVTTAADGTTSYAPRTPEEMQAITALVQQAIGYNADRGDRLEVQNLPFARPKAEEQIDTVDLMFGFDRGQVMQLAETGVLALVALLVMLLVVRPLLNRALEMQPIDPATLASSAEADGMTPLITHEGSIRLIPDKSMEARLARMTPEQRREVETMISKGDVASVEEALDQMISMAQVEGRVRASSLSRLGEIVEKHPEEAVAIVRNWMYQEG